MFQFTTTNVINSTLDLTTGKQLWTTQTKTDSAPASLNIKRVNNFKADSVVAVYKAEATDPELAKVTLDLSKLTAQDGDSFRLSIYVGLSQASQDSRYSNDMIYKGKPFAVDFEWKTSAAKVAEALEKTIKKYNLLVYGEKLLNVSHSGTFITIEATTEYQRFKKVNLEKFNETAHFGMGEYKVVRSLDDLTEKDTNAGVTATTEGYFVGKEGFGTYSYLLHNLRLPTWSRTRAFGLNQDETPVVGAKYNQYTLHYCVDRGVLGMNAVGDTVKSVTTHVFFVKSDIAEQFETALKVVAPNGKLTDSITNKAIETEAVVNPSKAVKD